MKNIKTYLLIIISLLICGGVHAQEQDTIRVRVMTYNLRFGQLASLEELASHIKSFKPDFVALEEVDIHTYRARAAHQNGKNFITELSDATGMFGIYGKTINYEKGYYGIGILSHFPYISTNKTMLPNPEGNEQRALLEGLFEMDNNDTIIFATTHLDVKSESSRDVQSRFITNHFKNAEYPVILGGDFNAEPSTKAIKDIMKAKWFSATNDDLSFPAWAPSIKIDYLFALPMNGWKVIRTQTVHSLLSDHLPVVTELEYIRMKK